MFDGLFPIEITKELSQSEVGSYYFMNVTVYIFVYFYRYLYYKENTVNKNNIFTNLPKTNLTLVFQLTPWQSSTVCNPSCWL